MNKRKRPAVIVTGPASRLPSQRGEFGAATPPDPITPEPRRKPGETFNNAPGVIVTNTHPRAQRPARGSY